MSHYGKLHETGDRFKLIFDSFHTQSMDDVFNMITDPDIFSQWYPFATGQMELKVGGEIVCDDGEGSTYHAVITQLDKPHHFAFKEDEDLVDLSIKKAAGGCILTFTHTFSDLQWAVNTAAGWHRCLDVLDQLIASEPIEWKDNASDLKTYYQENFN